MRMWQVIVLAVLVELFVIFIVVISGGAGHGKFIFIKVLFPLEVLILTCDDRLAAMYITMGLIHYPAVVLSVALIKNNMRKCVFACGYIIVHVGLICCLYVIGSFERGAP